jgi:hypothetical protein
MFVYRRGRRDSRHKIDPKVHHPVLDKSGIEWKGFGTDLPAFRHGLTSMLIGSAGAAVAQCQLRHGDIGTAFGIDEKVGAHPVRRRSFWIGPFLAEQTVVWIEIW